jgi:hypothetical protein
MASRDMLTLHQAYQLAMNDGYENHSTYQPTYAHNAHNITHASFDVSNIRSLLAAQAPVRFTGYNQYKSPTTAQMQQLSFSPQTGFDNETQLSSPLRGIDTQPQRSYSLHEGWQRDQLGDSWVNQCGHDFSAGQQFDSPPLAKEESSPLFHLGDPVAVPLGQVTFDMTLPKKHSRNMLQASIRPGEEHYHNDGIESRGTSTSAIKSMPACQSFQQPSTRRPSTRAPRAKGRFVHSICGTVFTSRYAVKKHHWGNKCDDFETTTGCWAKNKKPNVQW